MALLDLHPNEPELNRTVSDRTARARDFAAAHRLRARHSLTVAVSPFLASTRARAKVHRVRKEEMATLVGRFVASSACAPTHQAGQ